MGNSSTREEREIPGGRVREMGITRVEDELALENWVQKVERWQGEQQQQEAEGAEERREDRMAIGMEARKEGRKGGKTSGESGDEMGGLGKVRER